MPVSSIEEAIQDVRAGKTIVLVDEDGHDSEGFLCVAAETITAEAVNFMLLYGRGLVCLALTEERMRQLAIPLMVQEGGAPPSHPFGLSICAGSEPARVVCQILQDDGSVALTPYLDGFAEKHHLKIACIADLIAFRLRSESLVRRVAEAGFPTIDG